MWDPPLLAIERDDSSGHDQGFAANRRRSAAKPYTLVRTEL
jgi:hypothetical protein